MRRLPLRAATVVLTLALLGAGAAGAQAADSSALAQPPAGPFWLDSTRIAPATHEYDVVVYKDSATMPVGTYSVTIGDGTFAGEPAWMVVDHRVSMLPFVELAATDTVLLGRGTLLPLRWAGHAAGARLVAAFASDSVYGGATAPDARTSFTVGAAAQTVTSEGVLDVMLRTVPLAAGWSASASMLVADLDGARLVPLHVSVEREAQLELPMKTFDVWVLRAQAGGSERWFWVDKQTQVVIRSAMIAPHMPGMIVERVIMSWPASASAAPAAPAWGVVVPGP